MGNHTKLLYKQYGILVYSTLIDFLPKDRDAGEAKEEILWDNLYIIPDAILLYVGWVTWSSKGDKWDSSLLVVFNQSKHANRML